MQSLFRIEMQDNYFASNTYHTIKNPAPEKTSGNHHVINAVFLNMVCHIEGRPTLQDRETLDKFIEACRIAPGIFNRYPGTPDRQTHDDILAIAIISKLLALPYADEILKVLNTWQWKKVWFFKIPVKNYYDNENLEAFEIRKWFGRFFWFRAVVKACATHEELNPIDLLAYRLYLWLNTFDKTNETSGRQLRWITLKVMAERGFLDSVNNYKEFLRKNFIEGMREALGIYHGFTHPFSKFFDWIA